MLTSAKTESFASSMSWSVNFPLSAHWMESSKADSVPSKLGSLQKKKKRRQLDNGKKTEEFMEIVWNLCRAK